MNLPAINESIMNKPIELNEPTVVRLPKTFKQITQDYLHEVENFLDNNDEDSIPGLYSKLDDLYFELESIISILDLTEDKKE